MLTRMTDWKIPCVYIHVYRITKITDLVRIIFYVTLILEDIFRVSNAKLKGSAYVLLGEGSGKIWTWSC